MGDNGDFYKRFFIFLLFVIPIAYIGLISAVFIHETVGHGVGSLVLGGQFEEFVIKPDGMGWAVTPGTDSFSVNKHAMQYLAGPLSTLLFGFIFLGLAWIFKKKLFLSTGFVIVGINCLLEGPPYLFWNAIKAVPPGDVGRVMELIPSPGLRISILIFGGVFTLLGIIFSNIIFYNLGNKWLGNGENIKGLNKWVFLLTLLVVQAGAWFIFDWNQLAPGIGMLPNIIGTIITALTLVWIGLREPAKLEDDKTNSWILATTVSWALGIALFISIIFIFQHGVKL